MCRIAGIIDFERPLQLAAIDAMRDCMRHGGPDDAGTYTDPKWPLAMAVRRLALIDLSPAGHQPMVAEGEDTIIAFNGEVYNHHEIRATLVSMGCAFKSGTDTEVVLQAYRQWGTACFNRFNGMFALAVLDRRAGKLILARDHAGMKPLYYYWNAQRKQCYFASETRAFKTLDPEWPQDEHWRIHFLAHGHMPEPHTTLQHVKCLPKGHFMEIDLQQFTARTQVWYSPDNHTFHQQGATAANETLYHTLRNAVGRHKIADAPLGVFLSGGIDSAVIAQLAAEGQTKKLHTLSIDFEDEKFSEKKYQQLVADQIGSVHKRYIITQQDFDTALPDILQAMDQPSNDGINTYFICKYAKEAGLKAVLSGIGSDELFGGYPTFKRQKWTKPLQWLGPLLGASQYLSKDRWKRLSFLRYQSREALYLFHRGYFTIEQISELTGYDRRVILDVLGLQVPSICNQQSAMAMVSQLEQDFYLQNQLLRDTDTMSMWHSVEVRIPFLDKEVLALANQTHDDIRFSKTKPKGWLIDTFKNKLPAEIWNRKKMGFTFPFATWMRKVQLRGAIHPQYFTFQKQFLKKDMRWSRYWAYCLSTRQPIQLTPPQQRILFCTLRTFSSMGGIEKFNRSFGLALQKNALAHNWQVAHWAAYDHEPDERYFHPSAFIGFGRKRLDYLLYFVKHHRHFDVIITGHTNLSVLMIISGFMKPAAKRIMMAHGIESWAPFRWMARMAAAKIREIWSVSQFTANKITTVNKGISLPAIRIFPNTLDPFFARNSQLQAVPTPPVEPPYLLTISRLATTEQYKGYDQVIAILPQLLQLFPNLRYVLGGTGDEAEHTRIVHLIAQMGLQGKVLLPGFIPETKLLQYYQSAAAFVMPSRKEGFGIVFLEAGWMGIPVIGGNADGSPEALLQGQLGTLIDPSNSASLLAALQSILEKGNFSQQKKEAQRTLIEEAFGFPTFTHRQWQYLNQESSNLPTCPTPAAPNTPL
jgi:asparagine synthase (glutamine-hydrolysing)